MWPGPGGRDRQRSSRQPDAAVPGRPPEGGDPLVIQALLDDLGDKAKIERESVKFEIRVCTAAGCMSSGSDKVLEAFKDGIKKRELEDTCLAKGVGCMGPCAGGPVTVVIGADTPEAGHQYHKVSTDDVGPILDSLETGPHEPKLVTTDSPFFTKQTRVVLENCTSLDPERLDDYVAHGGYQALARTLTEMTPAEVIAEIMNSGLRGRGGAGYPTGLKWSTVAKAGGSRKFVVCNADEGDPGAFMDRSVLESDPHRVLEGMTIAAVSVGAEEGFIYCRAEYPLAVARLRKAIRQAERAGILGKRVMGTMHDFHLQIRLGAGAFVCGEETALLASIEGRRGMPRPRPPYPAESGLWGHSTLINNVETFACIPSIVRNGAQWYSAMGTKTSKGTKVFALAGSVKNTGLIEVPMGTTLREIVFDIGGGVPEGRTFKAVQTGGPSGGCIPADFLDTPVDYENLSKLGSIMGSGGMIVMDDSSNMVDVARYFMEFSMHESCGKCVPCRVGTVHMYNQLGKLLDGEGNQQDVELLEELCDLVRTASLCGLGQSAPNPVLSTLKYFRNEYDELLTDNGSNSPARAEEK
ncbi:NADH-quinone oxidoreductase subunit L [candidate division GN15 bacterium]|nr:NADH-quinone oxidoreductase subunit L [candidate division GN15 bacterium]